jgi:FkbM family methyltransferase
VEHGDLAPLAERVLADRPLSVVDVGSVGGLLPELEALAPWLDAVGFDPDEEACAADTARARAAGRRQRFFPFAIAGHDGPRPFHVFRKSASSSLLEPNAALHARFAEPERMEVAHTVDLETRALGPLLDELAVRPELLKLDVHGVEPEVLGSLSAAQWAELLAVHVELLLSVQYLGQAQFADVHDLLVAHGFELYSLKRYAARRASFDSYRHRTRAQITTADALYLRRGDGLERERRRRLAVVAACFGHNDAAVDELRAAGDDDGAALALASSRRPGRLTRRLASRLIRLGDLGWRLYGPSAGPWAGDRPPERF